MKKFEDYLADRYENYQIQRKNKNISEDIAKKALTSKNKFDIITSKHGIKPFRWADYSSCKGKLKRVGIFSLPFFNSGNFLS